MQQVTVVIIERFCEHSELTEFCECELTRKNSQISGKGINLSH